jgi:hypothetical protein
VSFLAVPLLGDPVEFVDDGLQLQDALGEGLGTRRT